MKETSCRSGTVHETWQPRARPEEVTCSGSITNFIKLLYGAGIGYFILIYTFAATKNRVV